MNKYIYQVALTKKFAFACDAFNPFNTFAVTSLGPSFYIG